MINTTSEKDTPLILVVDDEKSLRILLRRAMEKQGYQVIEASQGKECLEKCYQHLPDIILLDAIMPIMDGFTCCSQLHNIFGETEEKISNFGLFPINTEVYKLPPILMITGLDDPESVDRAFAAGATDYVTKPIHWPVLRQRVRRLLENGQLIKELQQQNEQERLMARMLERIRYSLNLDVILNTTVHEVRQFLQTDRVLIYRFDTDERGFIAVESVASPWKSLLGKTFYNPCFGEEYHHFYQQGKMQVIEDIYIADISECHKSFLAQLQVRAQMIVPIVIREQGSRETLDFRMREDGLNLPNLSSPSPQLWGLLIAHHCSQSHHWPPNAIRFVERLAAQGAIAIVQSQLYQRLEVANAQLYRLAALDGLTGLGNRRQFDEYLKSEWERSLRDGVPISLILCDVDFFKLYNDTYGHQAGDECLKKVALAIDQSRQQPGDFVARYGGEEFAVILPRADSQRVRLVAEAIRSHLAEMQIPHASSKVSQFLTLSLGVATFVAQESSKVSPISLETLVAQADKALYQAKQEGRDRTVLQIC